MPLHAVPADGVARKVGQIDSSLPLTLVLRGDEHMHFHTTADGFVVCQADDGGWYYALQAEGRMVPSAVLAHDAGQRGATETNMLKQRLSADYDSLLKADLSSRHRQRLMQCNDERLARRKTLGVPTHYKGSKRGLVILVDFANLKFSSLDAHEEYTQMFNQKGYQKNNHIGSVHDYFWDQSYGEFDLTFDVVGPVTMSRNYGYYGMDYSSDDHDMNVREMIVEACRLADGEVNYQDYDWDGDGEADQVFVIYAGYGQASGGSSNTIWPHESHLREPVSLDGVRISQYACSNEKYRGSDGEDKPMGIGTACHEFSHCLGLPDLYDTNFTGGYGMSYWSLMSSGSYNGPNGMGEVPCGYTAYERWFAGWLDFVEIDSSQRIDSMPSLSQEPVAYKIVNDNHPAEFFTIENRQGHKWYSYAYRLQGAHGLLITHIDFDQKAWSGNVVNCFFRHQRMTPVVADKSHGSFDADVASDLFPGLQGVTALTNTSHSEHGGALFHENSDGSHAMNKHILEISEQQGLIFFNVVFPYELPTPVALPAEDVSPGAFTAAWTHVLSAESYCVELQAVRSLKPFRCDTLIVDSIKAETFAFDGLDAKYCHYRVRANKGDVHTEWSNSVKVDLQSLSGIGSISQDRKDPDERDYSIGGMPLKSRNKGSIYIRNRRKLLVK